MQEENILLKKQNEELSAKLQQLGVTVTRTKEKLARYKVSDGRDPYEQIEEEEHLRKKLQVRLLRFYLLIIIDGTRTLIFCLLHVNRKSNKIETNSQKTYRVCVPAF